jgi:hypothetical protein
VNIKMCKSMNVQLKTSGEKKKKKKTSATHEIKRTHPTLELAAAMRSHKKRVGATKSDV